MSRIELTDSLPDVVVKMADGNPGAVRVMVALAQSSPQIDPDDAFSSFGPLLSLDTLEIYGSNIWILFKDVCGQNVKNVLISLRSVQLGLLSSSDLKKSMEDRSIRIDFDGLLPKIQGICPNFGKTE